MSDTETDLDSEYDEYFEKLFNKEKQSVINNIIADDILYDIQNIKKNYYLCCNIDKTNIVKFINFINKI